MKTQLLFKKMWLVLFGLTMWGMTNAQTLVITDVALFASDAQVGDQPVTDPVAGEQYRIGVEVTNTGTAKKEGCGGTEGVQGDNDTKWGIVYGVYPNNTNPGNTIDNADGGLRWHDFAHPNGLEAGASAWFLSTGGADNNGGLWTAVEGTLGLTARGDGGCITDTNPGWFTKNTITVGAAPSTGGGCTRDVYGYPAGVVFGNTPNHIPYGSNGVQFSATGFDDSRDNSNPGCDLVTWGLTPIAGTVTTNNNNQPIATVFRPAGGQGGDVLTWHNVNGGAGGEGTFQFIHSGKDGLNVTVSVNGVPLNVSDVKAGLSDDGCGGIGPEVALTNLTAGYTNEIKMVLTGGASPAGFALTYDCETNDDVCEPAPYSGNTAATNADNVYVWASWYDNGGEGCSFHNAGQDGNANHPRNITGEPDLHNNTANSSIGWTGDGDWLIYTVNIPTAGNYNIVSEIASGGPGSYVVFSFLDEELAATGISDTHLPVNNNGWDNYDAITSTNAVNIPQGTYKLKVLIGPSINFKSFTLVPVTPPTLPAAPVVTITQSRDMMLTVSWAAVPGADSYTVYDCDNTVLAAGITATEYTAGPFAAEQELCYRVTATNSAGASTPAEESYTMVEATSIDEDANAECNQADDFGEGEYWTIQTKDGKYIIDDGNTPTSVSGATSHGFLKATGTTPDLNARWHRIAHNGTYIFQNMETERYIIGEMPMNNDGSLPIECGCYIGNNSIQDTADPAFREANMLGLYAGDISNITGINNPFPNFGYEPADEDGFQRITTSPWSNHFWTLQHPNLADYTFTDPNKACPDGLVGSEGAVYTVGYGTSSNAAAVADDNTLFKLQRYEYGQYPNLSVEIVPAATSYPVGAEITGHVTVTNIGHGPVPADMPIKIKFEFDGSFYYVTYNEGLEESTGSVNIPFPEGLVANETGTVNLAVVVNSDASIMEEPADINTTDLQAACEDNDDTVPLSIVCPVLTDFMIKWYPGVIDNTAAPKTITVNVNTAALTADGTSQASVETYAVTSSNNAASVTIPSFMVGYDELALDTILPSAEGSVYTWKNPVNYEGKIPTANLAPNYIEVILNDGDADCETTYNLYITENTSTGTGAAAGAEKELKDCFNTLGVQIPCDEDYARGTTVIRRYTDGSAQKVLK